MTSPVKLPLHTNEGEIIGELLIETLPGKERSHTIDVLELVRDETAKADLRLLEECSYRFTIEVHGNRSIVDLEPARLFSPSDSSKRSGRLSTGRSVGTVQVRATLDNQAVGLATFEVRSLKINFDSEYQAMMLRIASEGAELVQRSFAESTSTFRPTGTQPAETIYQKFAFLQSILDSSDFLEAIEQIRHRPHSQHRAVGRQVDPARSVRPSARLLRELVGPGERQPIPHEVASMRSLPKRVRDVEHIESFDTMPNRFVKFALERWKLLAGQVAHCLAAGKSDDRGRREARVVEERLARMLRIPALAVAGRLRQLPQSNTVLAARAGYREVYRAFLVGDVAASIEWEGRADVFRAGQRDIATLYEYWVFLELLRIIDGLGGFEFERRGLIQREVNGLQLNLRRDGTTVLRGHGSRNGRSISLELWFNKTFRGGQTTRGSWTVQMRPDCSLQIRPDDSSTNTTWIHFDAKYRINKVEQLLNFESDTYDGPSAKTDDLRKMHAYRDAIHRTSGAYVLYPGVAESKRFQQFHEVLPGLGAFPLRPGANGEADAASTQSLRRFISDVIDHTSSQATSRERARYWQHVSYQNDEPLADLEFSDLLSKPPADTSILFGFVRNDEHLQWIKANLLYNLRADPNRAGSVDITSAELSTDFVVLYDKLSAEVWCWRTTNAFYLRNKQQMLESGYQKPTGDHYLCIELGSAVELMLDGDRARDLGASDGSPAVHTWLDVFAMTEVTDP